MKHRSLHLLLAGTVIALLIGSCANDNLVELSKRVSDSLSFSTQTGSTAPDTSSTASSAGSNTSSQSGVTDSLKVSFLNDIRPILIKYGCANCHGTYYASFGGASSLASSGLLIGSMSGAKGYRQMPPGQKVLSSELTLIEDWMKAGLPNN